MVLLLVVIAIFLILILSEAWWRRQKIHGEFSRKFVHITVGSFVAFWPYFLSRKETLLLSAAFVIVVLLSKKYNIFSSIHTVQRPTYGELFFALMVGALTIADIQPHIFTASLLTMSLADGFAAVLGTHYGKRNSYQVFGATKSVVGTLAFFIITAVILAWYSHQPDGVSIIPWVLPLSVLATAIENTAKKGLDNILVPGMMALALQLLS